MMLSTLLLMASRLGLGQVFYGRSIKQGLTYLARFKEEFLKWMNPDILRKVPDEQIHAVLTLVHAARELLPHQDPELLDASNLFTKIPLYEWPPNISETSDLVSQGRHVHVDEARLRLQMETRELSTYIMIGNQDPNVSFLVPKETVYRASTLLQNNLGNWLRNSTPEIPHLKKFMEFYKMVACQSGFTMDCITGCLLPCGPLPELPSIVHVFQTSILGIKEFIRESRVVIQAHDIRKSEHRFTLQHGKSQKLNRDLDYLYRGILESMTDSAFLKFNNVFQFFMILKIYQHTFEEDFKHMFCFLWSYLLDFTKTEALKFVLPFWVGLCRYPKSEFLQEISPIQCKHFRSGRAMSHHISHMAGLHYT
jgi:hypothetical protein